MASFIHQFIQRNGLIAREAQGALLSYCIAPLVAVAVAVVVVVVVVVIEVVLVVVVVVVGGGVAAPVVGVCVRYE